MSDDRRDKTSEEEVYELTRKQLELQGWQPEEIDHYLETSGVVRFAIAKVEFIRAFNAAFMPAVNRLTDLMASLNRKRE